MSSLNGGLAYWRSRLAPYAHDGFRRGVLDALEVVLFTDDGDEVHLLRPSARDRWIAAAGLDVFAATGEIDEYDGAENGTRLVLSVATARALLGGVTRRG